MKKYLLLLIIPILYFVPKLKGTPEAAIKILDGLDSLSANIDTKKLDSLERSLIGSDSAISQTVARVSITISSLKSTIVGLNKKVKLLETEVQKLKTENESLKKELDNVDAESSKPFNFFTRKSKDNQ